MSTQRPLKTAVTNNRVGCRAGRLVAGSWGRAKGQLRKEANRAVRRAVKEVLRNEKGME